MIFRVRQTAYTIFRFCVDRYKEIARTVWKIFLPLAISMVCFEFLPQRILSETSILLFSKMGTSLLMGLMSIAVFAAGVYVVFLYIGFLKNTLLVYQDKQKALDNDLFHTGRSLIKPCVKYVVAMVILMCGSILIIGSVGVALYFLHIRNATIMTLIIAPLALMYLYIVSRLWFSGVTYLDYPHHSLRSALVRSWKLTQGNIIKISLGSFLCMLFLLFPLALMQDALVSAIQTLCRSIACDTNVFALLIALACKILQVCLSGTILVGIYQTLKNEE